jgi:SLIT-ROBO Rho GTPase activating protein
MDFGFHQSLTRAILAHVSSMDQRRRSLQYSIDQTNKALAMLDSRLDKQKFIEANNTTFMIPKKFEYAPVRRDEVNMTILFK